MIKYNLQEKREQYQEWLEIHQIDKLMDEGYENLRELNKAKIDIDAEISTLKQDIDKLEIQFNENISKTSHYLEILNQRGDINYSSKTISNKKMISLKKKSEENYQFAEEIVELYRFEETLPDPDHYYQLESEINEMQKKDLVKKISLVLKPKENQKLKEELQKKKSAYEQMESEYSKYWEIRDKLEEKYKQIPVKRP